MLYAGAVVVTNRVGLKIDKVARRKESMWKRRLQNKVRELRKYQKIKMSVIADIGKDEKENITLE